MVCLRNICICTLHKGDDDDDDDDDNNIKIFGRLDSKNNLQRATVKLVRTADFVYPCS